MPRAPKPCSPVGCAAGPGNATALAARHPELAPPLLRLSLEALDGACDQALRLGRHAATARLAGFLLELLSERPGQNELQLAMKRADIAAHLGLNKESVSRSFTQLRRAGAIALPRPDRVHLLRPDRLRELANSTHPVLQPERPR
jgi:CRP/FNR family transcriptional regulator